MNNKAILKKNILKVNNNMKVIWEQQFPGTYGKKEFTIKNKEKIEEAIKELKIFPLYEVRKEAEKMKLMYYISQNNHNHKWGLDKQKTPEGGGTIAQSKTYLQCLRRSMYKYGIHPLFIYGAGVDGW